MLGPTLGDAAGILTHRSDHRTSRADTTRLPGRHTPIYGDPLQGCRQGSRDRLADKDEADRKRPRGNRSNAVGFVLTLAGASRHQRHAVPPLRIGLGGEASGGSDAEAEMAWRLLMRRDVPDRSLWGEQRDRSGYLSTLPLRNDPRDHPAYGELRRRASMIAACHSPLLT